MEKICKKQKYRHFLGIISYNGQCIKLKYSQFLVYYNKYANIRDYNI